MAGTARARIQTPTITSCDPGSASRAVSARARTAERAMATARSGVSVRRNGGEAIRTCCVSRTVTAAKRRMVSSSRTGRRTPSTKAGSALSTRKAFDGQSSVQLVYWFGTGKLSTRKVVGR
jgi:hypothetical protein